jgi:hypothetical protein
MELRPASAAASRSATQYCVQSMPPLPPVRSLTILSSLLKINFNIILHLRPSSQYIFFLVPNESPVCTDLQPFGRIRPLGSLNLKHKWVPETEINMFLGSRARSVREAKLTTLPLFVIRLSRQCGTLNISQPYRPPRPVTEIALLLSHVDYVLTSQESHVWAAAACYGDSFTFVTCRLCSYLTGITRMGRGGLLRR